MAASEKIRRLAWGLACLLATGLASARDRAETAPEQQAFRVEFSSSTSCRDPGEFERRLQAYTPRLRKARPLEAALTFVVQLVPTEAGVGGRLTVRELDGSETVREVPDPNCHNVISAMALISALTVDPMATPDLIDEPRPPAADFESTATNPAPAERERSLWGFGVGQRLAAQSAIAPGLTWGTSVVVSAAYAFGKVLHPSAHLATHFARGSADGIGGRADFTWLAARLSLCPVRWAPSAALSFRPCIFGDAGQLTADGFETLQPTAHDVFWSAAGIELGAEANIVGPLTVGAELGGFVPFRRDLFFFGASEPVHRIPAFGLAIAAGVGLRFF